MSAQTPSRQPAGVPVGGQFTTGAHPETGTSLTADRSAEGILRNTCKRRAAAVADRLRRMADDVERDATRFDEVPRPGAPSYGSIASNIYGTLLWGIPNSGVEQLARDAAEADTYRVAPPEASETVTAPGALTADTGDLGASDAPPRPHVRIAGRLWMMASSREATADYDLPAGTMWNKVRDGEDGPLEWTIVPDPKAARS